jgi:hypothetical protein
MEGGADGLINGGRTYGGTKGRIMDGGRGGWINKGREIKGRRERWKEGWTN